MLPRRLVENAAQNYGGEIGLVWNRRSLDLILRVAAVGALPVPSGEFTASLDIGRPPVTAFITS